KELRSGDPKQIIDALWILRPQLGRFKNTEPPDEEEASLIPDIRALLEDRRICDLNALPGQGGYFGEIRWNAATVLADLLERSHSSEPVILRDVIRPFTFGQIYQIAAQNGFDGTAPIQDSELFEWLHQRNLFPKIPELNLTNDAYTGVLYITG